MAQLLYVSGSGRSGSTLFERVLHASPRFQSLGEFHCLWRLPADAITCSCSTAFARDPLWQAALADAGITPAVLADLARLEQKVARSGFLAGKGFDLARIAGDGDVRDFLAPQQALFASLRRLSGRPILVDSSKAGPRAWLLATDPGTAVVHLWRHPTDVIASWRSRKFDAGLGRDMDRPSIAAAALDWWKVEHLVRRLGQTRPVQMIDYGALCLAPRTVIGDALAGAGIAGDNGIAWQGDSEVMPGENYHSLNGNPDRFGRALIRISERRADWSQHSSGDRLAIPAVGATLATMYPSHR